MLRKLLYFCFFGFRFTWLVITVLVLTHYILSHSYSVTVKHVIDNPLKIQQLAYKSSTCMTHLKKRVKQVMFWLTQIYVCRLRLKSLTRIIIWRPVNPPTDRIDTPIIIRYCV
ncbi:hypothetical protein HanIR_Chr07g0340381 [Helianthus annuus]|nr:hypothetical protein HanIR_Chr07g0340381 [Helianthus annuus]